jgi:hypothetical protein
MRIGNLAFVAALSATHLAGCILDWSVPNGAGGAGGTTSSSDTTQHIDCPNEKECTCPAGQSCSMTCDGKNCNIVCMDDATCTITCTGAACYIDCRKDALCNTSCSGASCTTKCDPSAICFCDPTLDCN